MDNLSKHFTYKECTKSATAIKLGIDNTPNESQLKNMIDLCENVLEPLREGLGNKPINISVFFRNEEVNKAVGGVKGSQHIALNGAAVDLDNDNMPSDWPTNKEIFYYIKDNLKFDQLIYEGSGDSGPGWIHVSFNKGLNRNEVLKYKDGSYTIF